MFVCTIAILPASRVSAEMPAGLVALKVTPARVVFTGSRARQQLVITGMDADGNEYDLTRNARFRMGAESVVELSDQAILSPVRAGNCRVEVWAGNLSVIVPVHAQALDGPCRVGFRNEVLPVITKAGCNSGACHGKPNGKNGFALSLRGYAPESDFARLSRENGGRRTSILVPGESLLLLKATGSIPHGGGRRFRTGSDEYAVLANWIGEGVRDDAPDAPTLDRLEIFPAKRIIDAPAEVQQLLVTAHFSDNSTRDVTRLSRFRANDELSVGISDSGTVKRSRAGEVTVSAEYQGRFACSRLLFRNDVPGFVPNDVPEDNYIDELVLTKLNTLRIRASVACDDQVFVRRVYLDAIGVLPTPMEIRAYLRDSRPDKRGQLIDELLDRPEFADWWAMKWADRLGCNSRFVGKTGAIKYHQWIRHAIAVNMPENKFVTAILTGSGGNYSEPAAGFYRRLREPDLAAEEVSQLFLGIRLQCAKCHNHPEERWLQDDYYGMAAFFARMRFADGPFENGTYDKEETVYEARHGEVVHPRTGKTVEPRFLGGDSPAVSDGSSRREVLASWLTAADNPYFARNAANRIWFHLMGRGICEPVDDFRASNPPSNEALLQALAADFVAHNFDRKHMIRTILRSRTYQFSSATSRWNERDDQYFSHYRVRLLGAEQILDAICDATGAAEDFEGFPPGLRAIQLPDGEFPNEFLNSFGRPARAMACECERADDSNLTQALNLVGGSLIERLVSHKNGRVSRLVNSRMSNSQIVDELFLATLSRFPSPEELARLTGRLDAVTPETRHRALEDVLWALLNHREFLFQH